jgi:putative phage-type endonuclease
MVDPRTVEQGSDEWKALRLGHVTASNIADIMAKGRGGESITRRKYKMRIVAERMTEQSEAGWSSAAMEWGTTQEPFARSAYEVANSTFVDRTGFWLHPTIKWVGVSPDGLVGDDGLVEIKCPNSTTHLDWLLAGKVPAEHMKQIQCQLWVTGREWCDFISFDPRVKHSKQLFVKRTHRDEELIKEMEREVHVFLQEVEQCITDLENKL